MRLTLLAATLLAAPPLLVQPVTAQVIHPDRGFVLNCHFTQSCIGGGCGEENYDAVLEVAGATANFRDRRVALTLTGGVDPSTGQMSFASEPIDGSSYFLTDFGDAGTVLTIHTSAEGKAIAIAFAGRCEEVL